MTPKRPAPADDYAAAVVNVLRPHFPDLADPVTAEIVTDLIARQAWQPQDWFEVIVDEPVLARWRLKANREDRRRVHISCFRVRPSAAEAELQRTLNEALQALDSSPLAAKDSDPR